MRRLGRLAMLLVVFAGLAPRVSAQARGQATAPTVNRALLQSLAGEYTAGTITLTVTLLEDGTLTLLFPGQPLYHLLPEGGVRFRLRELNPGFGIEFLRDANGAVTGMTVRQPPPQQDFSAIRKPRTAPSSSHPAPLPARANSPTAPPAKADSRPAARPPAAAAVASSTPATTELTPSSFSTAGLNYERDLTGLFLGDFDHLRIGRNSTEFYRLFSTYVRAFARKCSASLPLNKVEIMETECAREQHMVNKYGNDVTAPVCIEYRDVHTGLYADPELLAVSNQLGTALAADLLKEVVRPSTADPLATAMRARDAVATVGGDMQSLIAKNGCDSPGLRRFQANMLRFARNEPALRLAGGETIASTGPARPAPGTPFKDADYARLLDDLIVEQSKAWMVNRYFPGSLSRVTVAMRNADGRPLEIVAQYSFESVKGKTDGTVRLRFSEGLPQCLYFSDFPTTCRTPSPRIVTAYENNKYQR